MSIGDKRDSFFDNKTHNEILDTENKYCLVDLLKYVDDKHVLKALSRKVAVETDLPVNTVFLAGLATYSAMASRKYVVQYSNGDALPIGIYAVIEQPSGTSKSRCLTTFQKSTSCVFCSTSIGRSRVSPKSG